MQVIHRSIAPFTLAVTISLGLLACKAGERRSGAKPSEAMQPDRVSPMGIEASKDAGDDMAAPRPESPRPKTATLPEGDFGRLAPMDPPKGHVERLKDIEEGIASKDGDRRRKAKEGLETLVKENPTDAPLGLYLLGRPHHDLIMAGLQVWRQLKDSHTEWLPVLVTLFGHPDDRIRHAAINACWIDAKKEQMEKAVPYLKKAVADKSCVVKGLALRTLSSASSSVQPRLQTDHLGALDDACPLMQAYALEGLPSALEGKTPEPAVLARAMALAEKSPFYYVRCNALHALARLKVVAAEQHLAAALSTAAGTALVVYSHTERSPYTFNQGYSTLPDCAAHALFTLHGAPAKLPDKDRERVRYWLGEMARKKLAKAPGKGLCVSKDHCRKDLEICLHMTCTPNAKAAQAYWDLQLLERCQPTDEKVPYKNFGDEASIQVGFGLHWLAEFQVRKFLQKQNPSAYDKRLEEEKNKPCPAR